MIYFTGVEKNNDDSKRHYFSSNKHDAPGEIIRIECRQEALRQGAWDHPTCVRKRSYTKQEEEYWTGGGIQEVRKRAREDNTLMSFPILHLYFLHYLTNQLFSKLPHSQKVPLCAHPSSCSVCVCVCVCVRVCVYMCVCAVILVYACTYVSL